MSEQPDKRRLFQKFINNQCTAAEMEEVLTYINASQIPAEFEALIQENLEQKIASHPTVSSEISARLFQNIQASIAPAGHEAKVSRLSWQRKYMAIAATITLLFLGGLLYFYLPVLMLSNQEYTTAYGETEQILLPDGSSVVLNANSRLTVLSDWAAALHQHKAFIREVWLEGEAFFDVKELSEPTRFIVHTDDLKVEVLGTKFDVNSREQKTRVVLNEGKVKVKGQGASATNELTMKPGEMVELSKDNAQYQKKTVNPETYISWRHNELIFEATPITEIMDILKYNYGYEIITLNDSVNQNMLFTGKAPADDIELLLKMLSESFDISILQKDKKIIFQ